MTTAREVIDTSLLYVGKNTTLKQANNRDYERCLPFLNRLLSRWYRLGLRLTTNTSDLDNLESEVAYPDYAITGIEYNLAVDIWNLFNLGAPVNLSLRDQADFTKNELWTIGGPSTDQVFPGILPIGSGNEYDTLGRTFYPDCDDDIYSECEDVLQSQSGITLIGVDNG